MNLQLLVIAFIMLSTLCTLAYKLPASKLARNSAVFRLFSTADEDTVISRCTAKITDLLKPVKLAVTSSNDDPNGAHICIECISEEFKGKSSMQRQRLVYKALWDELSSNNVHAVDSIIARTPAEAGL